MVVAGYCVIRALDGKSTRWIALAGVAIGFAFLAKLLQALLVTPAFRAGGAGRRSGQRVAAAA